MNISDIIRIFALSNDNRNTIMEIVKTIGGYRVWYYPRKNIYRIGPVDNPTNIIRKDFKSLQGIINYLCDNHNESIVYTDPYNVAINWLRTANKNDDNYKLIDLLTGQYYYGIDAKNDLRDILIRMGLISININ